MTRATECADGPDEPCFTLASARGQVAHEPGARSPPWPAVDGQRRSAAPARQRIERPLQ